MSLSEQKICCLNCKKTEAEIPLLNLRYHGSKRWICSQCFPALIHAPQKLTGKIEDAEKIESAEHHKH